jgi:outer membrane protein assembly factor BamB
VLQVGPDLVSRKTVWTSETFGTHFMTAIHRDGCLYGVDGHGPQDAFLVCVDAETGEERWRTQPEWREPVKLADADAPRDMTLGTYRAWLMPVGGDRKDVLMLGEFGHLLRVDLSPKGYKQLQRATLFVSTETWTPPVLSRGLLYVCQNNPDRISNAGPRLLCYDLRGE